MMNEIPSRINRDEVSSRFDWFFLCGEVTDGEQKIVKKNHPEKVL